MSDPSPSRLLRRALEDTLGKNVASSVLFEALGAAGSVPQTPAQIVAVVEGPLRTILEKRMTSAEADALVLRIVDLLAPDEPTTTQLHLDELKADDGGSDKTVQMPTEDRAVPVLVIAERSSFASRLQMSLGDSRVRASSVNSSDLFRDNARILEPAIVILDATDFPARDERALIDEVGKLRRTTARVLWGRELAYARRITQLLGPAAAEWVTLELKEGIAPILDLVRSRRNVRRELP